MITSFFFIYKWEGVIGILSIQSSQMCKISTYQPASGFAIDALVTEFALWPSRLAVRKALRKFFVS